MIEPPDIEGIGSLSVNEILLKSKSSIRDADSNNRYCAEANWQATKEIGKIRDEPKKYNLKEPLPMRSLFNSQYSIPQWYFLFF